MKKYKLFEILGPTMIGPSSSHTAGACRLGLMARKVFNKKFERVDFYLHGSFQTTYQGHGSDRAFVGGVMGFEPDDERLSQSLDIAKEEGLEVNFKMINLEFVHPNTVKIVLFENKDDEEGFSVTGSSIGGGKIKIFDINGITVDFTGAKPTIVGNYHDRFGMIRDICIILTNHDISIANLRVSREEEIADFVMELDHDFNPEVVKGIQDIDNIINVIGIEAF